VAVRYPFVPKSSGALRPGDFWAVPRTDGSYACGRVLQVNGDQLATPQRSFFGGLLDWIGQEPPTSVCIAGAGLLDSGVMHIKAILTTGGKVIDNRPLELDGLQPPTLMNAVGGPHTLILLGAQSVRAARPDEWGAVPVLRYWGYNVIRELADARLTPRFGTG
jgi:hypothetical protein